MREPIYETNTCPKWLGAPRPVETLGDKIRGCEERIENLRKNKQDAEIEIAFQTAQLEAIEADLTAQENRLTYLEEQEQDEHYGAPE